MSSRAGTSERGRPLQFERPDFSRLPKDLVALYIAQLGCPTFFQTPREDGPKWAWRLLTRVAFGANLAGDGACERKLATRLAEALGIEGPLPQAVAAQRLHSFLQKDQLVAYDLATLYFERGIVGVDDAADKLFGKPLAQLELSQLAELALTLPPHGFYETAVQCRNESVIRQNRDTLLADLAAYKLVPQDKARNAMAQPVTCR